VVRFPGGRVMLIDGAGSFSGTFDPGERIVAPFLWANKIMHVDYVAVSHPDRDHFGGLIFLVRNFAPTEFWTGGSGSPDDSYLSLLETVTAGPCDESGLRDGDAADDDGRRSSAVPVAADEARRDQGK